MTRSKIEYLKYLMIIILPITVVSYSILFTLSPHLFREINNIGLTSFNISGLDYRAFNALFIYLFPGMCIALSGLLMFNMRNNNTSKVGSILILISGFCWAAISFYGLTLEGITKVFGLLHLTHIGIIWVCGMIGILLVGTNNANLKNERFVRITSIFISSLMFMDIINVISLSYNGIISSIIWLMYFLWFHIYGMSLKTANRTN